MPLEYDFKIFIRTFQWGKKVEAFDFLEYRIIFLTFIDLFVSLLNKNASKI